MPLKELYDSAYRDFSAWVEEHDPLGEMSIEDQAAAYCRDAMNL